MKLKKSDDQTNIDIYRVTANITEYHTYIASKLNFLRIIIPKLMMISKNSKIYMLKMDVRAFPFFLHST